MPHSPPCQHDLTRRPCRAPRVDACQTPTSADKRLILSAADRCTKPGEIGELMRRKGVYSSSPNTWSRQREAADVSALVPQKCGPKIDPARPHVCDDYPFSESQFKTMKYRADFPARLGCIEARVHCQTFLAWYNSMPRHSGTGYMTPHGWPRSQSARSTCAAPLAA